MADIPPDSPSDTRPANDEFMADIPPNSPSDTRPANDEFTAVIPSDSPSDIQLFDDEFSDVLPSDNPSDTQPFTDELTGDISSDTQDIPTENEATQFIPLSQETAQPLPRQTNVISKPGQILAQVDIGPGYMLQDRYRIISILGKGGFAAAYVAEDSHLKRRCVVKQMSVHSNTTHNLAIYQANFEREANLLAALNDPGHPNIPEIYDYFTAESGNYLIMKYIEGQDLRTVLKKENGPIPWQDAVKYAIQICNALNYMHTAVSEPVMHRDVKPPNILVGANDRIWLVDFGLAKADPVEGITNPEETLSAGSFGYTPLEQWLGQPIPASDIYALGATLHYMVTGLKPGDAFKSNPSMDKVEELHGHFTPIRKFYSQLPEELEDIINEATAADADKRPTAIQVQQNLETLIAESNEGILFTFKEGQQAKNEAELAELCQQHPQEAETYLYEGDFERRFRLINRGDLVQMTSQTLKAHKDDRNAGLKLFLNLIFPNPFLTRLKQVGKQAGKIGLKIMLSVIIVLLLVGITTYLSLNWFFQIAISDAISDSGSTGEYHLSEQSLAQYIQTDTYITSVIVNFENPDEVELSGKWFFIPIDVSAHLRTQANNPQLSITELYGISFPPWLGYPLSQGINEGIESALEQKTVNIPRLVVKDDEIDLRIVRSNDPVIVFFNTLSLDVELTIDGNTLDGTPWNNQDKSVPIKTNDLEIITPPPGEYTYIVTDSKGNAQTYPNNHWTLDTAYRIDIAKSSPSSQ